MSSSNCSRRRFLQLTAGVTAGAAVAGAPTASAFDWEDAAVAGGAMTGGPAGAMLTHEVTERMTGGKTVKPGTSTPEAIAESWWRTGQYARQTDNVMTQTMFNRLEDARTICYLRGKSAALKAMDEGLPRSEVKTAAQNARKEYYSTIQRNELRWWKVQLSKFITAYEEFANHSDVSEPEAFVSFSVYGRAQYNPDSFAPENEDVAINVGPETKTRDVELVNGETFEIEALVASHSGSASPGGNDVSWDVSWEIDPSRFWTDSHRDGSNISPSGDSGLIWDDIYASYQIPPPQLDGVETSRSSNWFVFHSDDPRTNAQAETAIEENGQEFQNMSPLSRYLIIWDKIVQESQHMQAELDTWVENAYGAVQAGEIDVETLLQNDPMLLADQWSTKYETTGGLSYAAADLATLGLSFDSDHRMLIETADGTRLEGTLYCSDDSFSIDVGNTVDPTADGAAQYYVSADTATLQGELASDTYRDGVDGGEIMLQTAPASNTEYVVTTAAGETVTVQYAQWTIAETSANDGIQLKEKANEVVYDASDELETTITQVASIEKRYAGSKEAIVRRLRSPFTILEAYDVNTGEDVDSVGGEGYNAGDSSVNLAWVDSYLEMRDNTDDYVNSGGGGGGGLPDWNGMDWSWVPSPLGFGGGFASLAKLAAVGLAVGYGVKKTVLEDGDDRARQ